MAVNVKWFKDKMADRGISQASVAAKLGMQRSAITKLFRAENPQKFTLELVNGFASLLDVPVEDVMTAAGYRPPRESRAMVPAIGTANASGLVGRGKHKVERPPGEGNALEAVTIEAPGDETDGWVAYFVPGSGVAPAAVGKLAVIKVSDGPRYLRVLRHGHGRGLWTLRVLCGRGSDISEVAVEWAAPVVWVRT